MKNTLKLLINTSLHLPNRIHHQQILCPEAPQFWCKPTIPCHFPQTHGRSSNISSKKHWKKNFTDLRKSSLKISFELMRNQEPLSQVHIWRTEKRMLYCRLSLLAMKVSLSLRHNLVGDLIWSSLDLIEKWWTQQTLYIFIIKHNFSSLKHIFIQLHV